MRTNILFVLIVLTSFSQLGESMILESAISGAAALLSYAFRCKYSECCDTEYVLLDTNRLELDLQYKLYGQPIAQNIVYTSILNHVRNPSPRKPLVLSFYGPPGSGKSYVATMIAKAFFKLGEKSNYLHFYSARSDFPSERDVNVYKNKIKKDIQQALEKCEISLFIFDDVDKMPTGVLSALVPFLRYSYKNEINNKSVFIFLSNTASQEIIKVMHDFQESGKDRDYITIKEFDSLTSIKAFYEKEGLYNTGDIESKIIDHHIPFLPLEEKHIIQCLKDIFRHWGISSPNKEQIREALQHVSYGNEPYNLYSTAGCKRLDHKVSYLLHK